VIVLTNIENLEASSLDIPINSRNKGYQLMKKMGWRDNTGLGKNNKGLFDL
jgi:hypothetical protein